MAAAAGIIAAIGGGDAQRATAYEQLNALARSEKTEDSIAVAIACVGPLIAVFEKELAEVDVQEYERVQILLGDLLALDLLRVGAEYYKSSRLTIALSAKFGNAFAVVFGLEPSELTREHAMTVGLAVAPLASTLARSARA